MTSQFITPKGFVPLENLIYFNIITIVTSVVGFPLVSALVVPSLLLTMTAGFYNMCRHLASKDALCIDVIGQKSVNTFNIKHADESDIMRFIGQLARLVTVNGKLFNFGSEPSTTAQASAFFANLNGCCGTCSHFDCRH